MTNVFSFYSFYFFSFSAPQNQLKVSPEYFLFSLFFSYTLLAPPMAGQGQLLSLFEIFFFLFHFSLSARRDSCAFFILPLKSKLNEFSTA